MKEKGITLIALVVTIVILLILAGVTLKQIGGNSGLLSRAKVASEAWSNAFDEIETIGNGCFAFDYDLEQVNILASVNYIGQETFEYSNIKYLYVDSQYVVQKIYDGDISLGDKINCIYREENVYDSSVESFAIDFDTFEYQNMEGNYACYEID